METRNDVSERGHEPAMNRLSRSLVSLSMAVVMSGGFVVVAPAPVASYENMYREVLKDGTKVEIAGDQLFIWFRSQRTLAKDGKYTLKSGKTLTVRGGKIDPADLKGYNVNVKK